MKLNKFDTQLKQLNHATQNRSTANLVILKPLSSINVFMGAGKGAKGAALFPKKVIFWKKLVFLPVKWVINPSFPQKLTDFFILPPSRISPSYTLEYFY